MEGNTRPFLSSQVEDSIRNDPTSKENGKLTYSITNTGTSPAFSVRSWHGNASSEYPGRIFVNWNDSSAYNVIQPNESRKYSAVFKSFFSRPTHTYWPFVLTYEYRIPSLSSGERNIEEEFEIITYVFMSTLVKTATGLSTLSADEVRIRGRIKNMNLNISHPYYLIEDYKLED